MTDESRIDLLLDFARLLKKHGPDTFEQLAADLVSAEWREKLADLLRSTATIAREVKAASDKSHTRTAPAKLRPQLIELKSADPVRGGLLLDFFDALLAKQVLASVREVRQFADELALPPVTQTAHVKAACALVVSLRDVPLDRWRLKVEDLLGSRKQGDRSLAGWSRIIHDPELRRRKAE